MKLQFPYFHRGKPAWIFSSLEMVFLWIGLAALIMLNILSVQKGHPAYWNKLMMLFESPFSVPRHVDLASFLWKQGQTQEARRLMASVQPTNVLGATSNPMTILNQWENEALKLQENYAFWQSVATAKPDYRDAYITLATLAYQMGKSEESRAWLTKAQSLDPNSPTVQEFLNYLPIVNNQSQPLASSNN